MTAATPAATPAPLPDVPSTPHARPPQEIAKQLAVDMSHGLDTRTARERLERYGRNRLPEAPRPSALARLAAQFTSPLVLVLLGAAAVATIAGMRDASATTWPARYGDALAILLIVALNAGLGFFQERKAGDALAALERAVSPSARVLREGAIATIPAEELVPGDLLLLEPGDVVAADARLVHAAELALDESSLTGESLPVAKRADAQVNAGAAVGDRVTMVHMGTSVVRGRGRGLVVATGPRTEFGRIGALIAAASPEDTPLAKRLQVFGRQVLWLCLAASAALFVWEVIARGRAWHRVLVESISFAVAVIPEGLPAITTIVLALGTTRMARVGAIVRRLPAVETLGAATVICTDKTGTLTENEMTVREAWAGGVLHRVEGEGYRPEGRVVAPDGAVDPGGASPALERLAEACALCNDAELRRDGERWKVVGDPTEGALVVLAEKLGVSASQVRAARPRVGEVPFSSERRLMTVVVEAPGGPVAFTKGSVEAVLSRCVDTLDRDASRSMLDGDRARAREEAERMSSRALRVLALATRARPGEGAIEEGLTFIGLVGMIDPPRRGVRQAIEDCRTAGIRVVMITGDHPSTALAIAAELGIASDATAVMTGADLAALDEPSLAARAADVRVFARTSPEQKLRIVQAFRAAGHVVAMTGDGVNDAPALRAAHIGVAMGRGGTDVARQAADLVLTDDRFTTLIDAVREGRTIWRNLQKVIVYLLSSNVALALAVFVAAVDARMLPLTPMMILCINLVTNGPPAIALGVDAPAPGQMREPPRRADAALLSRPEAATILASGAAMALGGIVLYRDAAAPEHGRAMAFSLLGLAPLLHAWNCRSLTASVRDLRPLAPLALSCAALASAAIHALGVVVPSFRVVFHSVALTVMDWVTVVALAALIVPVMEVYKLVARSRPSPP